jgi:hypothetical protein
LTSYAFPSTDLNFNCPNKNKGTVLKISLKWDGPSKGWIGTLVETSSKGAVVSKKDGLIAIEDGLNNRMDIRYNNAVIGQATQVSANQAILSDGKYVVTCAF